MLLFEIEHLKFAIIISVVNIFLLNKFLKWNFTYLYVITLVSLWLHIQHILTFMHAMILEKINQIYHNMSWTKKKLIYVSNIHHFVKFIFEQKKFTWVWNRVPNSILMSSNKFALLSPIFLHLANPHPIKDHRVLGSSCKMHGCILKDLFKWSNQFFFHKKNKVIMITSLKSIIIKGFEKNHQWSNLFEMNLVTWYP